MVNVPTADRVDLLEEAAILKRYSAIPIQNDVVATIGEHLSNNASTITLFGVVACLILDLHVHVQQQC